MVAKVIKKGWLISQLDINNVFLHGDIDIKVYMKMQLGSAHIFSKKVFQFNKSLYGLKQAFRQWYNKLSNAFISQGCSQSLNDYSLFHKKTTTSIFLVFYIDDVLIVGNNASEITYIKQFLHHQFSIKDLDNLNYFL